MRSDTATSAGVFRAGLLVCALSAAAPGGAAGAHPSEGEIGAAREHLIDSLAHLSDENLRADRLILIGYVAPDTLPADRAAARELTAKLKARTIADRSAPLFDKMTADGQTAMVRLYETVYPNLQGYSGTFGSVLGGACASPHPQVRLIADDLAAKFQLEDAYFPLRRRCNKSRGNDRLHAIETVGRIGDARAAWFLPDLLDNPEPGVREAAYTALQGIGRAGTLVLKERLTHADPVHRRLALRALMPQAVVDDLPFLYDFVRKNTDLAPALRDELFALIARLEVERDQGIETPGS